ncbi:MAG TPA: metabolite traffic protein EboE [Pirellulaceae bacterium]|nr:metabolite traffic protein EboE [Pirellulaceae bacterium]
MGIMDEPQHTSMISFGYCTNVYPGITLADVLANIERFGRDTREVTQGGKDNCPIGLWLAESAVNELSDPKCIEQLQQVLSQFGLTAQTFNGFPQQDFHQPVVKHRVYQPNWTDTSRLAFTCKLADILAQLLEEGQTGTISTLPIAWGQPRLSISEIEFAARQLLAFAECADRIYATTGRTIRLCLEPEPGCMLQVSGDVVSFLNDYVLRHCGNETQVRRHLAICHDVCHAAVMFEAQADAIARYLNAGWDIAKVQISSALAVDFSNRSQAEVSALVTHLARFAEPRYLHQTCVNGNELFEDLPIAIERAPRVGTWRTHFHVPIFARELPGGLATTQADIGRCVAALLPNADQIHWEIETYAWQVLPDPPTDDQLGPAIRQEITWLQQQFSYFTLRKSNS